MVNVVAIIVISFIVAMCSYYFIASPSSVTEPRDDPGMHSDAYALEMRLHDIMRMIWTHLQKTVNYIVDRIIGSFMVIAMWALCVKMVQRYAPCVFDILPILEPPRDEPPREVHVHVHVHVLDAAALDEAAGAAKAA